MQDNTFTVDRSVQPAKLNLSDTFNVCVPLLDRHIMQGRTTKSVARWRDCDLSYEQLYKDVLRLGSALKHLGLEQGDKIVLLVKDRPAYYQTFLASIRIGAVIIPANTFLLAKDYAYIFQDSGAKAVFVSDGTIVEVSSALKSGGSQVRHTISTDSRHEGYLFIDDLMNDSEPVCPPAPTTPSSQCFWLYSSGSTGSPKASVHEHKDIIYAAEHFGAGIIGIGENDIIFSAPKLFFAYGVGNSFAFPLYAGATAILLEDRPTPDNTIDMLNRFDPTIYFGVPTLYAAQLALIDKGKKLNINRLRFCHSGGEALPVALYERWKKATGLEIYDGIGSSEALHIYISNRPGHTKPGSSGLPVPGYDVRLVNADGQETTAGEVGEILVRGDSVTKFYWQKPEKNKTSWTDGWFRSGDQAYRDADGYLYFCGRDDDMIKVGGIWVAPFEVETALISHPAILEVAVVGAPDEQDLIKPKAYCVLRDTYKPSQALESELIMHVKTTLAPFKYPRWIVFVDELPKTASGKIQRFRLRNS